MWRIGGEFLLQPIHGHRPAVAAQRGPVAPRPPAGSRAFCPHQARHAPPAQRHATLEEAPVDAMSVPLAAPGARGARLHP